MKKVITLCGSTKFEKEYRYWNTRLTIEGWIVLAPGAFGHTETDPYVKYLICKNKEALDKLHFQKIATSECIFIVDVKGYIGSSTAKEIEYAQGLNKHIYYLSRMQDKGYSRRLFKDFK